MRGGEKEHKNQKKAHHHLVKSLQVLELLDGGAGLGRPPPEGGLGTVCKGGVEGVFKRVLNALRLDSLGKYTPLSRKFALS